MTQTREGANKSPWIAYLRKCAKKYNNTPSLEAKSRDDKGYKHTQPNQPAKRKSTEMSKAETPK